MKFGKRQLILGTLVLALGAAVYLSWMLSDDHRLLSTDALTSENEAYGEAEFVNASGEMSAAEEVLDIDDVINNEVLSGSGSEELAAARLSRKQARDSAAEMLGDIVERAESPEAVKEAAEKAVQIASDMEKESNIEALVKAKGYEDCVAVLKEDGCTVMVTIDNEMPNDAIIIKNIVSDETGADFGSIKIIAVA